MYMTETSQVIQPAGLDAGPDETSKPAAEEKINSNPTIGATIRELRTRAKMSQKRLANALGYSSAEAIGMVECGYRSLDLEKVPVAARVLGVDPCGLTRQALHEYCPRAAAALFEMASADPRLPREVESGTPEPLSIVGQEVGRSFEKLPLRHQQFVSELVRILGQADGPNGPRLRRRRK